MEFFLFITVLFCLIILLASLARSQKKLQDLMLMFSFLLLGNSILLGSTYSRFSLGGSSIKYMYLFDLNVEQAHIGFMCSLIAALIFFTIFFVKKIISASS